MTATITVTVPAEVVANPDMATVDGTLGDTIPNVVDGNDTVNGNPAELGVSVTIDPASIMNPVVATGGITLDPLTGIVTIDAMTPPGVYTIPYEICAVSPNETICNATTVEVTVASDIEANPDMVVVDGTVGGMSPNVVDANDTLNGNPAVLGTTVTIDPASVVDPVVATGGISLDPSTGIVTVDAMTPPGDYDIAYTICSIVDPTVCDTTTVTVTVPAVIEAMDDPLTVTTATSGEMFPDVIGANDLLNGNPAVLTGASPTVSVTNVTDSDPTDGVSLDPLTGIVTVDAMTPPGDYVIDYTIASIEDSSIMDDATITVTVPAEVVANPDMATVDGTLGDTIPNVVDGNDTLNGNPAELGVSVTIDPASVINPIVATGGITLDPLTGIVTIDAMTPPGVYTIPYEICAVAPNETICNATTVEVTVESDIVATPDMVVVDGTVGGMSPNIVDANDTLNGNPAVLGTTVTIDPASVVDPVVPTGGISLDPSTGIVTVDAMTPPGDYDIAYTICSIVDPLVCDTTTVTVTVPAVIEAMDDPLTVANATSGEMFPDVIGANDTLNGNPAVLTGASPTVSVTNVTDPDVNRWR